MAGCGKKAEDTTTTTPATETMSEAAPGGTTTINLNRSDQDTCVTFVPHNTSIRIGDRVNFTTNSSSSITVHVPAGLFSAGDTSIVVSRGPNSSSPQARAIGTYPLSPPTHMRACRSPEARGPSISVDSGESAPKP